MGLQSRETFHNQGGPYGRTNSTKRIVCVDVTGLPLCVRVVPASTSEARAVELVLEDLSRTGSDKCLELVLVDRGTAQSAALRLSARFGCEVRRVGWDEPPRNDHGVKVFQPIRHAWRVEVAHSHLVRRRRLARCFENTVASATGWLHVTSITEVLRAQLSRLRDSSHHHALRGGSRTSGATLRRTKWRPRSLM
jgi:putative transposase